MVQSAEPSAAGQPPAISIPSIEEVFPLEKCLQVGGGLHHQGLALAAGAGLKA